MYYWYHLYFLLTGFLLSTNEMVGMCIAVLYALFLWFHICIITVPTPYDFNTGSFCPICKRITGMGLKHCKECRTCVNDKWKHCYILNRCCDPLLRYRWITLFKLTVVLFIILTIVNVMINKWILLLMPLHLYMLKSTYVNNKNSINKSHTPIK